jgi:peroxiredoxin
MLKRLSVGIFIGILAITALNASAAKKRIDNFTLNDYNGVRHSLTDYQSSNAIVLMFIATQCPVSNAYNDRMVQLYSDYTPKGVAFVAINSNKQESVEEIKEHAKSHKFIFTVLKDKDNIVADELKASVTPEIFVLNSKNEILYHGRIDDSRKETNVKSNDLRMALDEILSGKPVNVSETKAIGCTIKRIQE